MYTTGGGKVKSPYNIYFFFVVTEIDRSTGDGTISHDYKLLKNYYSIKDSVRDSTFFVKRNKINGAKSVCWLVVDW